jgi:methionine synthase II (cobalamin-independent)
MRRRRRRRSHDGDEPERVAVGNRLVFDAVHGHRRCLVGREEFSRVPRLVSSLHVDGLREWFLKVVVTADDEEAVLAVVLTSVELDTHLLRGAAGLELGTPVLLLSLFGIEHQVGVVGTPLDLPREVLVVVKHSEYAAHLLRYRPKGVPQDDADAGLLDDHALLHSLVVDGGHLERRPVGGRRVHEHWNGTFTRRRQPVFDEDAKSLRTQTDRPIKWALPGPMTMIDTLSDQHYKSREKLAWEFATILNQEALELQDAGVDVIQFDEPAFTVFHDEVQDWGVAALERAAEGLHVETAVHICYGYGIEANNRWKETLGAEWRQYEQSFPLLQQSSIDIVSLECIHSHVPLELVELIRGKKVMLGAIDVASETMETPEEVAEVLRRALQFVDADKLIPSSNCGMAPLARGAAPDKLGALAAGANIVRAELAAAQHRTAHLCKRGEPPSITPSARYPALARSGGAVWLRRAAHVGRGIHRPAR